MKLQEMLGTKYPFIQGGMANIATGEFAASVSNAGGLGLVGAGGMDVDMLRENIRICKSKTDKPFGVNLMLMHPQAADMAQVILEEGVKIVTTGAGSPSKYIDAWKESGMMVIPVIAAGGIADGRQYAAAIALGAIGAQLGTCLLASNECPIHEAYKAAVLKAKDNSTTVTGRIAGTPVRVIKNKMAREYVMQEKKGATVEELEKYTLGSLRRSVFDGDTDTGSLMAGQAVGQLKEIRPLADIFEDMYTESQKVIAGLSDRI